MYMLTYQIEAAGISFYLQQQNCYIFTCSSQIKSQYGRFPQKLCKSITYINKELLSSSPYILPIFIYMHRENCMSVWKYSFKTQSCIYMYVYIMVGYGRAPTEN